MPKWGRDPHDFRDLDDRIMTDAQMWQWLTTKQFKHYVRSRWNVDDEDMMKRQLRSVF